MPDRQEYFKMYREKYKDEITEKSERYYMKNIEKVKLKNRLYYLEHRNELNQKAKEKRHLKKELQMMALNDIRVI